MSEQARDLHAEVAQIFMDAGWRPNWKTTDPRVLTYSQACGASWNVGGVSPRGMMEWANTALDPTTSNDPVETAKRLVAKVAAETNPLRTDVTLETPIADAIEEMETPVHEGSGQDAEGLLQPPNDGDGGGAGESEPLDAGEDGVGGEQEAFAERGGPIDAEFDIEDLGSEDDELSDEVLILEGGDPWAPPLLEAPEPQDFAPDEISGTQTPTDRFYGLDDLDRRRSLRLGDVVRISMAKQAAIWEASGATEDEFRNLTNAVMFDTNLGRYTGPQSTMDRFNELQQWANLAANVKDAERQKAAFLTAKETTREQIEAFDPEADWP